MHLIEIFLPLNGNDDALQGSEPIVATREELTRQFGGMTAFSRSPAEGVWENGSGKVHDEIVIIEVMVKTLDRIWWRHYRGTLEQRFEQEEILIRATETEQL